eukprot:TRINITY_DN3870_c0_g1_i1.p1 TRINITY_DN3870_c0_g1~~TRINITY_DN3870_c0_g1_i1.p1  ORF type:complete len:456 (-),score=38.72 TRINITY_DN3870_c0_g1_i1:9-1376(-)
METSVNASGNRGNSVSTLSTLVSSDGATQYHQIRDLESEDASAPLSRVKVEMDRSIDALPRPSDLSSHYASNQRIQSENSVGSTSALFHGHSSFRRSALLAQPHHSVPASGGISPMAMNSSWPTSSLFSHQLQSNPGQPSPPSSRRGSFSFASGPYAVLDSPFSSYMPQRTSFSFAADLSAPVAVPGVSAAPLPSALGLDFPEEEGSLQSIFHTNSLPQHLYYPSLPSDLPSLSSRRESRGEMFEFVEPDFPPKFSGHPHQLPMVPSSDPHPLTQTAGTRSQPSGSQAPRGRGRPAKRSRGGGTTPHQTTNSAPLVQQTVASDLPVTSQALMPQAPQSPVLPTLLPAGLVPAAFPPQGPAQSPTDIQSRKRRNSAVSLMLLGDPSLAVAPGHFGDALQNKDTPTSVSETPTSPPTSQRKTRKQKEFDEHEDEDCSLQGTTPCGSKSTGNLTDGQE